SKGVAVFASSMNLRLMKPRLRPSGSTALVITRPWYFADTATRSPLGDSKTLSASNLARKATSSVNVVKLGMVFSFSRGAIGLAACGVEVQATAKRSTRVGVRIGCARGYPVSKRRRGRRLAPSNTKDAGRSNARAE